MPVICKDDYIETEVHRHGLSV